MDTKLELAGFEKWLNPLHYVDSGRDTTRVMGEVEIAGKRFWVDCVQVVWAASAVEDYRILDEKPDDHAAYELRGKNADCASILDGAYNAFGLDGEIHTVKMAGRWYAVFVYPANN